MVKHLAFVLVLTQIGRAVLNEQGNRSQCLDGSGHPVCLTPACVHTASKVLKYLDEKVDPCDDFYTFACGQFLEKTVIPEDKSHVSSFSLIKDRILKQLKIAMEEPPQANEPKSFGLVKQFYDICMDTSAVEDDNLRTAKTILAQIGGWPVVDGSNWKEEDFDWKQTMYKFRKTGILADSLISVVLSSDNQNSSLRIIEIDEGRVDRDYLIKGFEDNIIQGYYYYLVDIAVYFGANRSTALQELKDSVMFEIELAKLTLPKEERRNLTAITNIMTVEELQRRHPIVSWVEYLNNIIGIPEIKISSSEKVDVDVPKFLTDLEDLLKRTPKRVLANYLISQFVIANVNYLTKALRNREVLYNKFFEGDVKMKQRWIECVEKAISKLNIASAALYVRRYFNTAIKNSATNLVNDLGEAFQGMLQNVDWMDQATKEKALRKSKIMASHVGYPSEFFDDEKLDKYHESLLSAPDNYLNLSLSIWRFKYDKHFKVLRDVKNKTDWLEHWRAASVNAYYDPTENSVQLSAGILQGIFFDPNRPQYMNYGAMGFAIGHEITHGFDDTGRQYDEDGNLVDWWGEETAKAYLKKAQCIIDQYGNYTYEEIGENINGIHTQGENIADNGGAIEAYLAYEAWVARNGEEDHLPGLRYTPRQLFWISLAHVWCSKDRKESAATDILTDEHSPSRFRVIGSLSNTEQFSKDFGCPGGSKMNPKHKCRVW